MKAPPRAAPVGSAAASSTARTGWWVIVACTWRRVCKDNLSALAAAAAFYALLSIFPTLTALVSLYGLVADPVMGERQVAAMQGVFPPEALKLVAAWLQALVQGPTERFGIGLLISVVLASWSVWSATVMLMNAVNICYGDEERRSFVRFNLEALALGAGLVLLGVAALTLLAVLPVLLDRPPGARSMARHDLAPALADPGGAGRRRVGNRLPIRARPGIAKVAMVQLGRGDRHGVMAHQFDRVQFLCFRGRKLRQDIWIARRGIVLLLWFYMTAYVILIGAELNAEVERHVASQ